MEQPEVKEQVATASASGNDYPLPVASAARPAASSITPQACATCGTAPAANGGAAAAPSYVYAIGRIEPRFPRVSVEKEFAQAVGRDKTSGLTDRQALHAVLSKPENRYLVRQLCWVMTTAGGSAASHAAALGPGLRHWASRAHRATRNVQRVDGADCGLRSDLLF
jgi:hypothetical protein